MPIISSPVSRPILKVSAVPQGDANRNTGRLERGKYFLPTSQSGEMLLRIRESERHKLPGLRSMGVGAARKLSPMLPAKLPPRDYNFL